MSPKADGGSADQQILLLSAPFLPATLSVFLVCFTGSKGKMPPTRAEKTEDNTLKRLNSQLWHQVHQ